MRVFISQLMKGRTEEEIYEERSRIEEKVHELYPEPDLVYIDSFKPDALRPEFDGEDRSALWCLGHSLKMLAKADLFVMVEDAFQGRGCWIELECAKAYGIPVRFLALP